MSREDVDRCALPDCGIIRRLHDTRPRWQDGHAFVEPARAEAPQGETCTCPMKGGGMAAACREERGWQKERRRWTGACSCSCHRVPAAQPETGGDEARIDSIADKWITHESPPMGGMIGRIYGAVREAYAAGRAAENEACEGIARESAKKLYDWMFKLEVGTPERRDLSLRSCERDQVADAIAERRERTR